MARFLLVLLVLCAVPGVHAAPAPLAMVTDVQGKVPGASLGKTLVEGSSLVLGEGTRLRLIYMRGTSPGRREVVTGPATVQVGPSGSTVTPAPALVVEKVAAPQALVPSQGLQRIGGSIEREVLQPTLLPTVGPVRFTWSPPSPAETTVRVLDGDRLIWECRTTRRVLDYAGPPLELDHRYLWNVEHAGNRTTSKPFRVISEDTRRKLEAARQEAAALAGPGDPTPHLLMMGLYLDHDMPAEAASEARAALDLRPDSALRGDLVDLLRQIRAWDAPLER